MDNHHNDNQHHRRECKHRGNKKIKLIREKMDDFHPDNSRDSIQCTELPFLQSAMSVPSDDGTSDYDIASRAMIPAQEDGDAINTGFAASTVETSMNEASDIINLALWITTYGELLVTALYQRYINPFSMRNKCRKTEPVVDNSILQDLQREFGGLSLLDLSKLVHCCQKLPYSIHSSNGQLNERAIEFMSEHHLTQEQLIRVNEIGKKILLRSSYGVLFVRENKFFAKTNANNKKRRSAIKGYPFLKPTGEYEHPWETAVRITKQTVQYWNNEMEEWQWLDMNEHMTEDERRNYLECLITAEKGTEGLRYIGLFVIRLKPDIQIRINDNNPIDNNENWYSIDGKAENVNFYTIRPFLKYLQQHRNFV